MEHDAKCERGRISYQLMHPSGRRTFVLTMEEMRRINDPFNGFPFNIACNCGARENNGALLSDVVLARVLIDFMLKSRSVRLEQEVASKESGVKGVSMDTMILDERSEDEMGGLIRIDFRNRRRID